MLKSKTFWAAIIEILLAIVAWATGEIDLWAAGLAVVAGLGVIFYRSSIDQNLRNFFNKFKWFKSKTVWTMAAAILATIAGIVSGEIELVTGLMAIVGEFVAIFLRSAQAPEEG